MSEWLHTAVSVVMILSFVLIFTGLVRSFDGGSGHARRRRWLPGPTTSVVVGSLVFVVCMMAMASVR